MQKLNQYWEEEKKMKPKRENWRDRKNKIKKCNIVGTKPHLFAIYMYSDCATHIQRRICMHVHDFKRRRKQRRRHAILSDVLHKSLLSNRWLDSARFVGRDGC